LAAQYRSISQQRWGSEAYTNTATYFSMFINGVGDAVLETFNPLNQSRQWNLTDTMSIAYGITSSSSALTIGESSLL